MNDSTPTVRRFAANEWRVYRALPLHGRGVGRLVIDSVLDRARPSGVRQPRLSVALGPSSALEFYRRFGFIEIGEPVPLRNGSAARKQLMLRVL